jgi:hypothetical protein
MAEGTAMGADDHDTLVVPRDPPEGDAAAVDGGDPAAGAEPEQPVADGGGWDRWRDRVAIGLTLLPLVVAAFVVAFQMHGDFYPTGDHALIELQARDVGRHPVLFGLFSRADWAHPGPMFAYLSAPVYRLLGEASVSLNLLALLINGGSLAGMALIARRLAGTPAMLATLLAQSLMMRTLGAEFLRDTWNPYITILPYGLMVFLTWAMLCRRLWALPVGVFVATYLAQVHVGFVALALPLLGLGAAGLAVGVWRHGRATGAPTGDGDGDGRDTTDDRLRLRTTVLWSAAFGAVMWIPPVIDMVNGRNNFANIVGFFTDGVEKPHTWLQGWGAVTGQFAWPPEWLTDQNGPFWSGEETYMYTRPLPVLLALVALAGVVLWRRGGEAGRRLVVALGATLLLGMFAVARTVGLAFYYRLRWLWIGPVVAFVAVVWAAWVLIARRWPKGGPRVLAGLSLAVLAVLAGVNVTTAVTTDTRMEADAEVVEALLPDVLDEVEGKEGVVVLNDSFGTGAWYERGLALQLERRGYDVRVTPDQTYVFGERRVYDGDEEVAAKLVVVRDQFSAEIAANPDMRLLTTWTSVTDEEVAEVRRLQAALDADLEAGRIDEATHQFYDPWHKLYDNHLATYYEVKVYVQEDTDR